MKNPQSRWATPASEPGHQNALESVEIHGGALAPRRDSYMWFVLASAAAVGLLQWLLSDWPPFYWLSLCGLTACGAAGMARCVVFPNQCNLWDLFAASIALAYGGGGLYTELTYITSSFDLLSLTFAGRQQLARSVGLVLLVFSILSVLGRLDTKYLFAGVSVKSIDPREILFFVVGITLANVLLIATGKVGFHGDITHGTVTVSPMVVLLIEAVPCCLGMAVYAIPSSTVLQRRILLLCIVLLMCVEIYEGRRAFMFAGIVAGIFYFSAYGPSWFFSKKGLMVAIISIVALSAVSRLVFSARLAYYEISGANASVKAGASINIPDLVSKTYDIALHGDRIDLSRQVAENEGYRTYILGYFAELVSALDTHDPVGGDVAQYGFSIVVPFILWPDKLKYMVIGMEEAIYHGQLGLPVWDAPNTALTSGAADFGIAGLLIYPVLLAGLYVVFLRWASRRDSFIWLFSLGFAVYHIINIECTIGGYLSPLRNIFIFIIGLVLYLRVIRWMLRWTHREHVRRPRRLFRLVRLRR